VTFTKCSLMIHVASRVLGLTLTSRNNGGASDVPHWPVFGEGRTRVRTAISSAGFRVAICEQVEDPRQAKGVVRREVVKQSHRARLSRTTCSMGDGITSCARFSRSVTRWELRRRTYPRAPSAWFLPDS
jgi:DNA mismatch repair ATPase MutS